MAHIFGDTTDDITFGTTKSPSPSSFPEKKVKPMLPVKPREAAPPRPHFPKRTTMEPRASKPREHTTPEPVSLSASIGILIDSMKPSYLPNVSDGLLRFVILSETKHADPLMLVRSDDVSLIFGTGFSSIENAGKVYDTLPDMRLISSEKDRLA